jgi:Tol biopolymer transport system component
MNFGGAPQEAPPSMGVAGAMSVPDPAGVPAAADAGVAPIADCVLGDFQEPELLTGLEQGLNPGQGLNLWSPSLTAEGSTLFFAVSVDGVDEQIAVGTRDGRGAAFAPAAVLAGINSAGEDGTPLLSSDGRSLYFHSTRAGGLGDRDVWLATRADGAAEFTVATLVAGVNGPNMDHVPWVSPDELTILWATNRSGGVGQLDIWIARRSFRSDGFSSVAPLNGVNSAVNEGRAVLSNDELTIYFASERAGGVGGMDLWAATREDGADTFSQVTNLAGLNSSSLDQDPVLSADERELVFVSGRDGRIRLWRSVRDCE